MRRRIALYGATEEALQLLPMLEANPDVEVTAIFDPYTGALRARLATLDRETAAILERALTDDPSRIRDDPHLQAIVDAGIDPPLNRIFPEAAKRGLQIVAPLTARLLWGYGVSSRDRKAELLQALHEVVESVELAVDADELFSRMLEIAISVTGADRGSLMLLDPESRELRVRVAVGIEPELWAKIRVPLGEGIAGRVAANARPMRLRGKADRQAFQIVRERLDVESALCVPLVNDGQVLGVVNLHHTTRPDVFTEEDLAFAEQLGRLDAQIIARAQEHATLRDQAARYEAVREVRRLLAAKTPLLERLGRLCRFVAARSGSGIATVYLYEPDEEDLRLAATSLSGGGLGAEYRVIPGQGLDGRAAREHRPLFLRHEDGRTAYAALPLIAGDVLVGVLSLQAGEEPVRGRAAEENLLEIAAAAADEIAQAEREARMAARATKASAINESGIRMISTKETADVVRLATSSAAMILEADHAVVRLQDEGTRRYVIRSYFGSADGRMQERLFRLDKRVCVDVIKRRAPLLVRELEAEGSYAELGAGVRSLMAAPLKREGCVVGTIAVYEKVAADRFYPGTFNEDDLEIFARFGSYVERAVEHSVVHSQVRRHRSFDEDTGLPTAAYLGKRLEEEIARASGRSQTLAVITCRVENLEEIRRIGDPVRVDRVIARTVDALRGSLRDFDVLARSTEAEFTALLPEPEPSAEEQVSRLARAVADDVAKDDALNDPVRIALGFGYALYPDDGSSRETLLTRASQLRIRTL
jgi:GAF domain-containing protein